MMCPHIYYGVLGREDSKLCHLGEAVTTILNVQEKEDQQQKKKYLHAYSTRENKQKNPAYSLTHIVFLMVQV